VSVCVHISRTMRPPLAPLYTSGFVDDVMFSYNWPYALLQCRAQANPPSLRYVKFKVTILEFAYKSG